MNAPIHLHQPAPIFPKMGRDGLPLTNNYDDPTDITDAWADHNEAEDVSVVAFFDHEGCELVSLVAVGIEEDGLTIYRHPAALAATGQLPIETQMRLEEIHAQDLADRGVAA